MRETDPMLLYTGRGREEGVTLLISILVMSGLVLISLSVAVFSIQELRSSRAVLITEPAISAAETAGEQGLWAINRGIALNPCPTLTNPNPTQTNLVLGNGAFVNSCKSYSSATLQLEANVPLSFYLYDPANINGNVDLLTYPYNTMTVIHKSGQFQVSVSVVRLDGTAVGAQPVIVPPAGTQVINIPAVANTTPPTEGRMKVTLLSTGNATVNVDTNQGLPSFPTVSAGGCASRTPLTDCISAGQESFNRRINITLGGGLSGLGGGGYPTPYSTPIAYPSPYATPVSSPTLVVSPSNVSIGDVVTATFSGITTNTATDWIAMYNPITNPNNSYNGTTWKYTNSCTQTAGPTGVSSGTCNFTIPFVTGDYQFRLLASNGTATARATSNTVTATQPTPTLVVSPSSVTLNGVVTATFSNVVPSTNQQWITYYRPINAPNPLSGVWKYTSNCTQTLGGTPLSSGSCSFTLPNIQGSYQFRLFDTASTVTALATSNTVTVTSPASPTLVAAPSSLPGGGLVTVNFSSIPWGSNKDWLASYRPITAINTAWQDWMYINSCTRSSGVAPSTTGYCVFNVPNSAGGYQFRLLANDGYTVIATSNTVTVP